MKKTLSLILLLMGACQSTHAQSIADVYEQIGSETGLLSFCDRDSGLLADLNKFIQAAPPDIRSVVSDHVKHGMQMGLVEQKVLVLQSGEWRKIECSDRTALDKIRAIYSEQLEILRRRGR